jgi:hypothetical protein
MSYLLCLDCGDVHQCTALEGHRTPVDAMTLAEPTDTPPPTLHVVREPQEDSDERA